MFTIKIPATTANMGPGFDSIGMALALYNYVAIREGTTNGRALEIRVNPPDPARRTLDWYAGPLGTVPRDENNLIYQTICDFYRQRQKTVPPLTLIQENHIPMTGGLGSSAACVVSGLLAANRLTGDTLSRDEIINLAAKQEGHPDNTTPALSGGITVGVMTDSGLVYRRIEGAWENRLRFALFVPDFTVPTARARAVLPESYRREDAVYNLSRGALLTAALITGDFEKLSAAMEDRIHQPYRQALMPGMAELKSEALRQGAYNMFLSGAGSALMAVTTDEAFVARIRPLAERMPQRWQVGWVKPDMNGAVIMG